MRDARLTTSTPQLDAAEVEWWDRFGPLSERLWAFDDETARALRGPYVGAAAEFVGASGGLRVLDLGCGSGFLSRLLAEHGANVVGVDVSEVQVAFARAATRNHACAESVEFHVRDAAALLADDERFDAVVTHAFLHHLASDELDELVAQIAKLLVGGGRAWFYEPVFYPDGRPSPAALAQLVLARLSAVGAMVARSLGVLDTRPFARAEEFYREAERAGYFLSPKEVPFRLDEIETLLGRHLEVINVRWVTATSYVTAQWVANVRRPRLRRLLSGFLVRPLALLELGLSRMGGTALYRGLPGYGFAVAECRAPAKLS